MSGMGEAAGAAGRAEHVREVLASVWKGAERLPPALLQEALELGGRVKTSSVAVAGIEAALGSAGAGAGRAKLFHNLFRASTEPCSFGRLLNFERLTRLSGGRFLSRSGHGELLRRLSSMRVVGEGVALSLSFSARSRGLEKLSLYAWPKSAKDVELLLPALQADQRRRLARGFSRGCVLGIDLFADPGRTVVKIYDRAGRAPADARFDRLWPGLRAAGFQHYRVKRVCAPRAGRVLREAVFAVPATAARKVRLAELASLPQLSRFRRFLRRVEPALEGAIVTSINLKRRPSSLQLYFVFPEWVDLTALGRRSAAS